MTAAAMMAEVDGEPAAPRRPTIIDLYYIHWPRTGQDMRPAMEGLETARAQGKIRAVGVSNFSVEQMRAGAGGRQDRRPPARLQPALALRRGRRHSRSAAEHGIAVVTYSSLAHGILTGKFARDPGLRDGDQRHRILPFRADIWPHVYEGVEKLKAIAAEPRPSARRISPSAGASRGPASPSVVVGARNARAGRGQRRGARRRDPARNASTRMTAISDEIVPHVPNEGNLFGRKG